MWHGLKPLSLCAGGTLFVVCISAASIAIAALAVLLLTISVLALHTAQPVRLAMVCIMAKLASLMLFKLVAHLTLCVSSNLVKLMVRDGAIAQLSTVDCLKVFRKSL